MRTRQIIVEVVELLPDSDASKAYGWQRRRIVDAVAIVVIAHDDRRRAPQRSHFRRQEHTDTANNDGYDDSHKRERPDGVNTNTVVDRHSDSCPPNTRRSRATATACQALSRKNSTVRLVVDFARSRFFFCLFGCAALPRSPCNLFDINGSAMVERWRLYGVGRFRFSVVTNDGPHARMRSICHGRGCVAGPSQKRCIMTQVDSCRGCFLALRALHAHLVDVCAASAWWAHAQSGHRRSWRWRTVHTAQPRRLAHEERIHLSHSSQPRSTSSILIAWHLAHGDLPAERSFSRRCRFSSFSFARA